MRLPGSGNDLLSVRNPRVGNDDAPLRCNFRNHFRAVLRASNHAIQFSNGGENNGCTGVRSWRYAVACGRDESLWSDPAQSERQRLYRQLGSVG
jgi:hypothetical protein